MRTRPCWHGTSGQLDIVKTEQPLLCIACGGIKIIFIELHLVHAVVVIIIIITIYLLIKVGYR